jgi:hypothetical protein
MGVVGDREALDAQPLTMTYKLGGGPVGGTIEGGIAGYVFLISSAEIRLIVR